MTAKRGHISMATHVPHRKAQYEGIVLGIGLGGFVDGIVLHQVLQWHNMLSNWIPPTTLEAMHVNMGWDGVFHAVVWLVTLVGVFLLWSAAYHQERIPFLRGLSDASSLGGAGSISWKGSLTISCSACIMCAKSPIIRSIT